MTGRSRLTAGEAGRQPWPCRRKKSHNSHGACPGIDFPQDFQMAPPVQLVEPTGEEWDRSRVCAILACTNERDGLSAFCPDCRRAIYGTAEQ